MDALLGENRAFLDDLFYCPHHPEAGHDGEIKELKLDCNCRKPKNGMFLRASNEYNIDLNKSWIIGDRYADIHAGKISGCKTILLKTGHSGNDKNNYIDLEADYIFDNLQEAVTFILEQEAK